jgi:hypothetical protein
MRHALRLACVSILNTSGGINTATSLSSERHRIFKKPQSWIVGLWGLRYALNAGYRKTLCGTSPRASLEVFAAVRIHVEVSWVATHVVCGKIPTFRRALLLPTWGWSAGRLRHQGPPYRRYLPAATRCHNPGDSTWIFKSRTLLCKLQSTAQSNN